MKAITWNTCTAILLFAYLVEIASAQGKFLLKDEKSLVGNKDEIVLSIKNNSQITESKFKSGNLNEL